MHFEVEPGAIYSALFPFSDLSATKHCRVGKAQRAHAV